MKLSLLPVVLCLIGLWCCSVAAGERQSGHVSSVNEEEVDHDVFDQELFAGGAEERRKLSDLSPAQAAEEVKKLVSRIDENKDGRLDKEELVTWFQKVEDHSYKVEADTLFEKEDGDKDGFITLDEFWTDNVGEELPTNEEDFDDAQISAGIRFQGADANKDGRLDKEEFVPFIHPFRHDHMVGHLVEDQLVLYDEDQDGHISFNEYLTSYNPDNLTDDELPDWMEDAESEFTDKLDQDHNGLLDYKEIKEWLAPSEEVFFKEEAQHLLSHVDKDKDGFLTLEEIEAEFDIFVDSPATNYGHVIHEEL